MESTININDWQTLTQFLPNGWEDKAKELGALDRRRKFKNPSDLLRTLLIHFADKASLVETTIKARLGGIADISDVALLKRIKSSAEWFRWMSNELIKYRGININPPDDFIKYKIRAVDASVISEPGSTGTDWRLHYSLVLFGLNCDEFNITDPKTGESFVNFKISTNDLLIGDRAYGRFKGMKYVLDNNADFLVRFVKRAYKIYDNNEEVDLLEKLKKLEVGEIFEIKSKIGVTNSAKLPVRICAIKKSDKEAEESIRKMTKSKKKKQQKIDPITLEYHRYIIITTSLPEEIPAKRILDLYRLRWQIELSFKRLKSIFGLGHLPKKDENAARAWLHGKIFVSILTQMIIDEGQFFSPWGYPIS